VDVGPIPQGASQTFQVTGRAGVPTSNVAAVVLNVNATSPDGAGNLKVYPDDQQPPVATDVTYSAGDNAANTAIVPVDSDGRLTVLSGGATTQVQISVSGYFSTAVGAGGDGNFTVVGPTRLVNTATGLGVPTAGSIPDGGIVRIKIAGVAGMPANPKAAVLNFTTSSPSAQGYLRAWPDGGPSATPAVLSHDNDGKTSSASTVQVGANGYIDLQSVNASVQVTVDIEGVFTVPSTGSGPGFIPMTERIYDSRNDVILGAGETRPIKALQDGGITYPPGAALHLAAYNPQASGGLRAWSGTGSAPSVDQLSFDTGESSSSFAVVSVGSDGYISVKNTSGSPVQFTVDLQGWFPSAQTVAPGTATITILGSGGASPIGQQLTEAQVASLGGNLDEIHEMQDGLIPEPADAPVDPQDVPATDAIIASEDIEPDTSDAPTQSPLLSPDVTITSEDQLDLIADASAKDPRYALIAKWTAHGGSTAYYRVGYWDPLGNNGKGAGWGDLKIREYHNLNKRAVYIVTKHPRPDGNWPQESGDHSWAFVNDVYKEVCYEDGTCVETDSDIVRAIESTRPLPDGTTFGVFNAYCLEEWPVCPDWVKRAKFNGV
jgi:hypothetical protein